MAVQKRDILNDIRILQLIRGILFLAGALALVVMLKDQRIPINALYVTKDALTSQSQTVFVPALKNLFDAPVAFMAATALVVSGGIALYRYGRGQDAYKKEIKKGDTPLKWIDVGVSSAIIIEIVALFAGVSDPGTVKMCAGAIVATCALGWLADRQNAATKKPDWSAYAISVLTGILPWLAIASSLLFTAIYGMVRLPWYSYALAGAMLVGFGLLAINQMKGIKKVGSWKKYNFVERNYLIIDVAIKVAFVAILLVGLKG